MKPAMLPADLEAALDQFKGGGGVVEYFVFELDTEIDPRQNATQSSNHETAMRAVHHQLEQRAQPKHLPLEPLRMIGAAVTLQQFSAAIDNSENILHEIGVLADDPPFHLQRMPDETRTSFDAINTLLFNDFSDDLEIMRWSEGFLEWWGVFWWTVHNRSKDQVVVIKASQYPKSLQMQIEPEAPRQV